MKPRAAWMVLLLALGCSASHPPRPGVRDAPEDEEPAQAADRVWALRASRDQADRVSLHWRAPTGLVPDAYVVLRDDIPIAELSAESTSYDDSDAEPGQVEAPRASAGQGSRSDAIELSWSAADTEPGPDHRYRVQARLGDQLGPSSDAAAGARAAPRVEAYDVCREPCDTFARVDGGLSYLDRDVAFTLLPGRAQASAHVAPSAAVTLTVLDAEVELQSIDFRVRARTELGTGPMSLPVTGRRKPGPLHVQWQRAESAAGAFADLPNVTGVSWVDERAPLATRLAYRARLHMDGALDAFSAAVQVETAAPAREVASSRSDSCALLGEGELACWGGIEDIDGVARLPRRPAQGRFFDLRAGGGWGYFCALARADGSLHCWGDPENDAPHPVTPLEFFTGKVSYRHLVVQEHNACAIRAADGRIECFAFGSLGKAVPALPDDDYAQIALSTGRICALRSNDSQVVCSATANLPVGVFTQLLGDYGKTCALRADHSAVCWNDSEQAAVPEALASLVDSRCGLRAADRRLVCWSSQQNAALPLGIPLQTGWRMVSGSYDHACAISEQGRVSCWGGNSSGAAPQLPFPEPLRQSAESYGLGLDGKVRCLDGVACEAPPEGTYSAVAASVRQACALSEQGFAVCWGKPREGATPPPTIALRALTSDSMQLCGLRDSDGAIVCWGSVAAKLNDVQVASSGLGLTTLTVWGQHACALDAQGALRCFGDDVGLPDARAGERYLSVATQREHSCAIRRDTHTLQCWGASLATGRPFSVDSSERYQSVVTGASHVCALRETDHRVACWGDAGLPDGISRGAYAALSIHGAATCAIREPDGKRVCWGRGFVADDGLPAVTP